MSFNFINLFNFIIIALIMIPNIIYAIKSPNEQNICTSKFLNIIEQIGRYGCIALMILPLFVWEFAFSSPIMMLGFAIFNSVFIITYLIVWIFYFKRRTFFRAITLAVVPSLIFLTSGICLSHYLLILCAVIFAIGHISITYVNNK